MDRFFGGNPLRAIVTLVLLSIAVGIVLSTLGLDALALIRWIPDLFRRIYDLGFEAFHWLFRYFLLGATIVIPVWVVVRLLRMRKDTGSNRG
jgi:hypothetical protein